MTASELRSISTEWLDNAECLLANGRWRGAYDLAGYCVELALKARICEALGWTEYREGLDGMKTHHLETLVQFTGREADIKTNHFANWAIVVRWNPEACYQEVRHTENDAKELIAAVKEVLHHL